MVSFTDHYNAVDRLYSKTKIRKDSRYFNNSLLCESRFSSATKTFPFLLKTQKKPATLQQVTGRNTPNLVLKRILRYLLTISPLKKILQFHDWKKTTNLNQIKPMFENCQDKLYLLENKQANNQKSLIFVLALGRSWKPKNAPKLSSKCLKFRTCKIKQYLNYILMIINQNILPILGTFLNLQINLWKTLQQANFLCYCYWIS